MTKRLPPLYWQEATAYLSARDKTLAAIITSIPEHEALTSRGDAFFTLARSIAGQQISVKAADSIWARMESGLGSITPTPILAADEASLRSFGLSSQKVRYLKHAAEWAQTHGHRAANWHQEEDEAIIAELVALPGIGRWTAEMFLIFHLMKPDVLPIGDVGLVKAVSRHYLAGAKPDKGQLTQIGERWRPWRSVATWYLWRSLDPVNVEY